MVGVIGEILNLLDSKIKDCEVFIGLLAHFWVKVEIFKGLWYLL